MNGRGRSVLLGVVAVAGIALVAVAWVVLSGGGRGVAASPSPSPSASQSAAPSGTPVASEPATPSPSATAAEATWSAVATFAEAGATYLGAGVVAWDGGFVAAGTRYASDTWAVFGPPPPREGRLWRSDDGATWTDATPAGLFADVELRDLFVAADGALVVLGATFASDVAGADAAYRAWSSADGATWTEIRLAGIPDGASPASVEVGAAGLLLNLYEPSPPLWHSTDGLTWASGDAAGTVREAAAGDEGFVASLYDGSGERIVASSDGRSWVDGPVVDGRAVYVAGIGPDWIRIELTFGGEGPFTAAALFSADGLSWAPRGEFALGSSDARGDAPCHEVPTALTAAGGLVIASSALGGCGEGAVRLPGAAYGSGDVGASWERMPFGDHAGVVDAAQADGRIVVLADRGTNSRITGEPGSLTIWLREGG